MKTKCEQCSGKGYYEVGDTQRNCVRCLRVGHYNKRGPKALERRQWRRRHRYEVRKGAISIGLKPWLRAVAENLAKIEAAS